MGDWVQMGPGETWRGELTAFGVETRDLIDDDPVFPLSGLLGALRSLIACRLRSVR